MITGLAHGRMRAGRLIRWTIESMNIDLERDANVPLYLQIKERLQKRIERGLLLPGARLPATRALARDLGVSRVTVVNAYAELEAEGWVQAHVGRGTFVADPQRRVQTATQTPYHWQSTLLGPAGVSTSGMLADMLHLAQHPDLISFAMGAPATDLLPVRDFREAINHVLRRDGGEALQYDEAAGYKPLRAAIVRLLAAQEIRIDARDVLITSGSQQALDLAARALTQPGDRVITGSPTYLGALDVFRWHGVEAIGVPVDEKGLRVDLLDDLMSAHDPRFIYTIPGFHNPTGVTLALERRWELLRLARRHDVPVLEDGVCSELRYEGASIPSLRALDGGEQVIYVNSFSKFLLPGMRVGYAVAPQRLRERLIRGKRAADLLTGPLMQRALARYLESGRLAAHLETLRRVYGERRDAMLAALARRMPEGTRWTRAEGGLCLWVTLPEHVPAGQLYVTAIEHGVAFAVGSVFFPPGGSKASPGSTQPPGASSLRLNFAAHPPGQIDEGLRRLGRAVRERLGDGTHDNVPGRARALAKQREW
jgi:DNA-binding transcriptional MocR family regulator